MGPGVMDQISHIRIRIKIYEGFIMQFSKLYTSCIALLVICGLSTVAHADFTNVTNTFVVSSSTTDPNEANNTATDVDQPNFVDLSVTKTITE